MNNLKTTFYRLFSACIILLLSNFYSNSAWGQCNPAASDPNFNPNDIGFGLSDGFSSSYSMNKIVHLSTNKILVGGGAIRYNGQNIRGIVKLNEDGSLDNSFASNYTFYSIMDIKVQADGKILVANNSTIIRLNSDGTVDNSFSVIALENTGRIYSIDIQSDGKIIAGGLMSIGGNTTNLVRFNTNGSLDNTFTQGVIPNSSIANLKYIRKVVIQNDGKILAAGLFSSYNGTDLLNMVRVSSSGTVDSTFTSIWQGANAIVKDMALQSDGKIVIAGNFTGYGFFMQQLHSISRLNSDGSLDFGFSVNVGAEYGNDIENVFIQSDGKILINGYFGYNPYTGTPQKHVYRLNTNGSIDYSLRVENSLQVSRPQIIQLPNGKLLTNLNITKNGIERLNQDGSFDNTFNTSYGFNNQVHNLAKALNGQFFAQGEFGKYDNTPANKIAKINPNGTIDDTFNFSTGNFTATTNSIIRDIAIQPDGKLFVAGLINFSDTANSRKIIRLKDNGKMDSTFNSRYSFNPATNFSVINHLAVQPDGKVLVEGSYYQASDIFRLNNDGSRDFSFNTGFTESFAKQIVVQPDGKILIAGYVTYQGISSKRLIRVLPNGGIDPTFDLDINADSVHRINLHSNGDIVIYGDFIDTPPTSVKSIRKVNSNGIAYPTFNAIFDGVGGRISELLLQDDGKVIITGNFNQILGNNSRNIGRLNADGTYDTSFDVGTGTNSIINGMISQPDNTVIIAGNFVEYNGTGRNRIAKLTNQAALVTNVTPPNQQTGICRNITTDLVATGLGNVFWYDSPTNPTPIHIGDTLTTPIITQDSTYFYAQDSIVGCGSSNRLAILVTVADSIATNAQSITAYLDSMGIVTINAFQIDSLSRVGCGDTIVSYTFRDTGLETRSYSCADTSIMHEVWLQITDNNGNIDTAQAFIQVRDTIAPVVQTQPFAVSLASNTSSVTVSALDLIYSLSDNCTDSTDITVVFANTGLATQDFSCGNFSNTNLRITDNAGNSIIVPTIITPIGYDLGVNFSGWGFRPAEYSWIWLDGFNRTCVPVSGQIQVTLDNLVQYSPIYYYNPPSSVVGNVLTWDFDDLSDASNFMSYFRVRTVNSANIGDQVCFTVRITPTNGDTNLANNNKTYCYNVVNSYDPNDKQVYPQGICDDKFTKRSDLPLTYTIRFQNTGNAPALRVNIIDSLSSLLNRRSLRVVGTSHAMVVDTTANNNVINFVFDNINLPDSTSSPELSQGYVIFELDEIATHTDTSRIENRSFIYFDTNAPIITNSVKNTIVNVLPLCTPPNPNPTVAACQLPTNLRTEILTSTRVRLLWTSPTNTNAVNYEILRNGQRLITIPASNLSYIDSTLIGNTQYNYSIKAICGNSVATSATVQVRTIPSTPILLSVVAACKGEKGRINVQSAGAVYRVYDSETGTTPLFETTNASIETPILNDSTTFYITVLINGQESKRLKAVVPIKEVFDAIIEQGALLESCTTSFTLSAQNVEGATYTWFRDNTQVGTERILTTAFEARYKIRVVKNGCFDESEFTTTRFVNAPTAKIQQGNSVTFCGSGILNAQDTSSNVTYEWILNGNTIKNGTSVSVSQTGTYTLKASQPSCADSTTIVVTITNAPTNITLTADKTSICPNTETLLSVTSGTDFTYKWFRNTRVLSNSSASLSTSELGRYKVEVTVREGCKTETNEVEITGLQLSQASLRINAENGIDKTIDVTSQGTIDSVMWFKDGVEIIAFVNQRLITPTETGNYKAKVIYETGCSFETEEKLFIVDIVSGIEEESAKIFTVYPNPNNGSFKVEFATTTNQNTILTLVDGLGRIIYSQEVAMNEKTMTINLPKISVGVYVVQIISEGKVYTKQLIIQ
jgi:uncharacterized delta-60 repeat protein